MAQSFNNQSNRANTETNQKGGLEFMALRFNVLEKRKELRLTKKITPAEYFLLEEIELATIGARNRRSTILSKAEMTIQELSDRMGYKEKDKIWKLLKSLHTKKLITREATEFKGLEIIGLNPEIFGQLLIDKHHELEQRRKHVKLVVDNSQSEPTEDRSEADDPSGTNRQSVGDGQIDRTENDTQDIDIIEEKTLLDSSRSILDSSKGKNRGETFSLLGGKGIKQKHCPTCAVILEPTKNYCSNACAVKAAEKAGQEKVS